MPMIYSLSATLTRDEAMQILAPPGIPGRVQRWQRGHLRAIASIYIPYRLYKTLIDDRGVQTIRYCAVDAASGTLDPYEFPGQPAVVEVTTRNALPALVEESQTRELAIEKVRRLLYSAGFFRLMNPTITAELAGQEFYVPYWAGFFDARGDLKIAAVNAVRHSVEGEKVRCLIQEWLIEQPLENSAQSL